MSLQQDGPGGGAGGPCDDLPAALAQLVEQVAAVKTKLAGRTDQVRWTGSAAAAFHDHAATRYGALAELIQELSESAAAAECLHCLKGVAAV
jgi:uncharacterized protein YukE